MSEHRVSVPRALRRFDDPELSTDPRVQAVVLGLRELDYAPRPDPHFVAELRAQLVAITPRIVAESDRHDGAAGVSVPLAAYPDAPRTADSRPSDIQPTNAPPTDTLATDTHPTDALATVTPLRRRSGAHRAGSRARTGSAELPPGVTAGREHRWRRPLAVAATVAATFVLLLGGAVWLSQRALPGDALYGLKRASENVQLDLTSGNTDRGHAYLSQAETRVSEARALLHRNDASAAGRGALASGVSATTQHRIDTALTAADSDVRQGWLLLLKQADKTSSGASLSIMKGWAPDQLDRLAALRDAAPDPALRSRAISSWTTTNDALQLAKSWRPGSSASGPAVATPAASPPAAATATTSVATTGSSTTGSSTTASSVTGSPGSPTTGHSAGSLGAGSTGKRSTGGSSGNAGQGAGVAQPTSSARAGHHAPRTSPRAGVATTVGGVVLPSGLPRLGVPTGSPTLVPPTSGLPVLPAIPSAPVSVTTCSAGITVAGLGTCGH